MNDDSNKFTLFIIELQELLRKHNIILASSQMIRVHTSDVNGKGGIRLGSFVSASPLGVFAFGQCIITNDKLSDILTEEFKK